MKTVGLLQADVPVGSGTFSPHCVWMPESSAPEKQIGAPPTYYDLSLEVLP